MCPGSNRRRTFDEICQRPACESQVFLCSFHHRGLGFLTVSLRDGVERCDVPTELQVAKGRKRKSINKVWVIQLFGKRPKGSSLQSPLLTAVASTLVGSC